MDLAGLVYVSNTTVIVAVKAAGMFGLENVQPATEQEIAGLDNERTRLLCDTGAPPSFAVCPVRA